MTWPGERSLARPDIFRAALAYHAVQEGSLNTKHLRDFRRWAAGNFASMSVSTALESQR